MFVLVKKYNNMCYYISIFLYQSKLNKMIETRIYNEIANEIESVMMSFWGYENSVFSAETVNALFDNNPDEKDFMFHIHCPGGSTTEGLTEYDLIRNSGKNIFMNIDGECHSMALTLLLAAPIENRTANPNCRALMHQVRGSSWESLTASEFREMAETVETEQNAILDIYAERTGTDRAVLETKMKEEKIRTAQELLDLGFISKINSYNTNYKPKTQTTMDKKKQEVMNAADSFITKLKNFFGGNGSTTNTDFKGDNGEVAFSADCPDEESLAEGVNASPDGTFVLPSGKEVTILNGVITAVEDENSDDTELEQLKKKCSDLETENETLKAAQTQNENLKNLLTESESVITNLKAQIGSTYVAGERQQKPKTVPNQTSEERKAEIKNKLKK